MIFQKVAKLAKTSTRISGAQTVCIHTDKRKSQDEIKMFLKDYHGGSVDLVKKDNGIAHLVLNHPERRNALSGSMMVDLAEAVDNLESWHEGVGVVFRGATNESRVFCSGGDLNTVDKIGTPEFGLDMSILMSATTEKLRKLPLVSVCLIDGLAVGGGAELTTATDYRVGTKESAVRFVHARMGVAPGWGGAGRLARLVGKQRALELLLTCRKIDIESGCRLGFFDNEIGSVHCVEEAEDFLFKRFEGVDPSVVRALKIMVLNDDPEKEANIFAPLWGGPANKAALEKNLKHR